MRIVLFSLLVSFYFLSQSSWAGLNLKSESMDGAFLDPAYPVVVRPSLKIQKWHFFGELPSKSDTEKLIQMQTPVKSQGSRGTCSIFSATALLESLLNVKYKRQLSLIFLKNGLNM